jgi:hypothetical protein
MWDYGIMYYSLYTYALYISSMHSKIGHLHKNKIYNVWKSNVSCNTSTVSRPIVSSSVRNVQQQQKWKLWWVVKVSILTENTTIVKSTSVFMQWRGRHDSWSRYICYLLLEILLCIPESSYMHYNISYWILLSPICQNIKSRFQYLAKPKVEPNIEVET